MKKPYILAILILMAMSLFCAYQCIVNFPNWLAPLATSIVGTIYVLYLERKEKVLGKPEGGT